MQTLPHTALLRCPYIDVSSFTIACAPAGDCQVFPVIYGEFGTGAQDPRDVQVRTFSKGCFTPCSALHKL